MANGYPYKKKRHTEYYRRVKLIQELNTNLFTTVRFVTRKAQLGNRYMFRFQKEKDKAMLMHCKLVQEIEATNIDLVLTTSLIRFKSVPNFCIAFLSISISSSVHLDLKQEFNKKVNLT